MAAWSNNEVLQRSPCSWALTTTPNARGVVKSRDARGMLVISVGVNGVQNRSQIDSMQRPDQNGSTSINALLDSWQ